MSMFNCDHCGALLDASTGKCHECFPPVVLKASEPRENYRKGDPRTSVERAMELDTLGNKEAILAALSWAGIHGKTTSEIAESIGKERAKFSSQITQLRREGHVFYAGRCREKQMVWVSTKHFVEWALSATPEEMAARDAQQEIDLARPRPENQMLKTRVQELEAQLHEVREIFAGMEGFEPETAPEGYAMRIINQMYEAARGKL